MCSGRAAQLTGCIFISQRKQHIHREGTASRTEGDGAVVFGGNRGDALGAKAMVPGVAGRDGAAVLHGDGTLVAVTDVDGQQLAVPPDGKIDGTQAFVQCPDGIEGIFQQIAEQGIDVGILHEVQAAAIGNAVESNAVFLAVHILFGEDHMGQEFANAKNYGWYGPAMNLHRSAFSGRNFEYYSEDGVLSGKFASAEVNSAARFGVYAFLKHFAANDQETNRCAFLLTYMSEQTLRENVLKPFEIVVKNFDYDHYVLGMMTSYNWLGTVPVISNRDLLTDVLRGEWGFVGTVISDYNGSYGFQLSDAAVRAGNDLMLGYGMSDSNKFEDTNAATLVLAMRQACKNILYTVGNSGYYVDPTAIVEEEGMDNMTRLFTTVNVSACAAAAVIELIVVVRWLLKKKKIAKNIEQTT